MSGILCIFIPDFELELTQNTIKYLYYESLSDTGNQEHCPIG